MKSREEVEALKANWQFDPIWDIENTEGFEDHKEELLTFRKKCERSWEEAAQYRKERSVQYNLDAAVQAIDNGNDLDNVAYSNLNYQAAIAHSLVALVAAVERLTMTMENRP